MTHQNFTFDEIPSRVISPYPYNRATPHSYLALLRLGDIYIFSFSFSYKWGVAPADASGVFQSDLTRPWEIVSLIQLVLFRAHHM